MKFPRNARIFRGHLDMAPFAAVFFLLAIFLTVGSLVYTPGVRLQLPLADNLAGPDKPAPLSVAMDKSGQLYFENQLIAETDLKNRLREAARKSSEPLTMVIQADAGVSYERLFQLSLLARDAGISEAWLEALPRMISPKVSRATP
jgi:biopolymer transport protein ExbD